jgi:hypothetical protein
MQHKSLFKPVAAGLVLLQGEFVPVVVVEFYAGNQIFLF